jgi:hypothetical protein
VVEEIESSINKVVEHIERMLSSQGPDYEFNIDKLTQKYSIDLVFKTLYKQHDLIDFDDPHDSWSTLVDGGLEDAQTSVFFKLSILFPPFRHVVDWLAWHFTEQGKGRKKLMNFIEEQTKLALKARAQLPELERQAKMNGTPFDPSNFVLKDGTRFKRNMIDFIIDQFIEGKITKEQYFNNSAFLFAAADKTASDCLTYTLYRLAIDQGIQEKLRKSIEADGIESEYLDWVVKESLRLVPPAPIGCSRTISHDMETKEGYVVPAGTLVLTVAYVIHRLKEYWGEDAEEFKPERWSDTSNHHPLQYIPFGAGPRGCPGKWFAMFEMKMLLTTLLSRYKLEGKRRDDEHEFNTPMFIFVIPNSPTMVKITRI